MKSPPEINAIARPLRIVYVIEDSKNAHKFLDAAFSESFGRHGGRQSLVVPVVKGEISNGYIEYLKAFDADAAFIVTANNSDISEVLGKICPSLMIYAIEANDIDGKHQYRFRLAENALSSLSWLPFLKVTSGGFRSRPEEILDCYPHWVDDGLIIDNFGTLCNSFEKFPLHQELNDLVKPLILTPADAPDNRWRFGIGANEVNNAYEVLNLLGRSANRISLAYLSNIYSKNISIRSHKWTNSFCLIVGDTFTDRISCWNAGLLFDDAQHQTYKTLRLPSSVINDTSKIEQVINFINNNNWINSNNGQPKVTIRSYSLNEEQLKELSLKLSRKGSWCSYQSELISSIDDCCPPASNKNESNWISLKTNSDLRVPLRHETESVTIPQPFHLIHASTAHPICSTGQWVAQYKIDRTNDNNRFDNVRDNWLLPNRNQLARLFIKSKKSRVTSEGAIAIQVDSKDHRIEVSEPSDIDFFNSLLHEPLVYSYPDIRYKTQQPIAYAFSRRSDKGRYLEGVLGMFGSLNRAYRVLTHGFWRQQFINLGSPSENQHPRIINTLKKRFIPVDGKYTFERDDQWESLAKLMVSQAQQVRQPKYTIKLHTLQNEWAKQVELAIEQDGYLEAYRHEILSECRQELTNSLAELCREGVFHQGYNWACRQCGYQNWTALDALKIKLDCQVCHQEHHAPIDLQFDFRMNEFLATCIREHDTLSVIWALGKLQEDSNSKSFIYSPQRELFRSYPINSNSGPNREIDLLCVVDGKVVLGEVKNSIAEIDNQEIENLIILTKEICPDIVIIAVMKSGEGDLNKLNSKLAALRNGISKNVDVRGILGDFSSLDHYLP